MLWLSIVVAKYAWVADVLRRLEAVGSSSYFVVQSMVDKTGESMLGLSIVVPKYAWVADVLRRLEAVGSGVVHCC